MTEEEKQQVAVYLKLQDNAKSLIKQTIFETLTNNSEDNDPFDDVLHSVVIELIESAIISDPKTMDKSNPCVRLQQAIIGLVGTPI